MNNEQINVKPAPSQAIFGRFNMRTAKLIGALKWTVSHRESRHSKKQSENKAANATHNYNRSQRQFRFLRFRNGSLAERANEAAANEANNES